MVVTGAAAPPTAPRVASLFTVRPIVAPSALPAPPPISVFLSPTGAPSKETASPRLTASRELLSFIATSSSFTVRAVERPKRSNGRLSSRLKGQRVHAAPAVLKSPTHRADNYTEHPMFRSP